MLEQTGRREEFIPKEECRAFIDGSILFWRNVRDGKVDPKPPLTPDEAKDKAPTYIDAYQSMRVAIFGRQLP